MWVSAIGFREANELPSPKTSSRYIVWSQVVETVSGMKYFDYLQSTVLGPMGLRGNVKIWLTDPSNHINDPVTQESSGAGQNVQTHQDTSNEIVYVYGGDSMFKETAVGLTSLATTALTLVKFISKCGDR